MNINLDSQARKQALADIERDLRADKRLFMALAVESGRILVKILRVEPGTPHEYYLNDTACTTIEQI